MSGTSSCQVEPLDVVERHKKDADIGPVSWFMLASITSSQLPCGACRVHGGGTRVLFVVEDHGEEGVLRWTIDGRRDSG